MTLAKYLRDRHKALTVALRLASRPVDRFTLRARIEEVEGVQRMHAERSDKSRQTPREVTS